MKFLHRLFLGMLLIIISSSLNAQTPGSGVLDVNKVSAKVYANGYYYNEPAESFWGYQVPKGSNKSTISSLSTWIAGYDVNGYAHFSGNINLPNQFIPGPIMDPLVLNDSANASSFDRLWNVNSQMIAEFKTAFANGQVTNGTFQIPADIAEWPGNHPVLSGQLAPFVDVDLDGIYNPYNGDFPKIKGNQMLWWVYNDNTTRDTLQGIPLCAEFRVSFYAYYYDNPSTDSLDIINYTTFMDVEICNRSSQDYYSSNFSVYSDFDIGYTLDDYIGCHVDYNSMYAYNCDFVDGSGQFYAYGGPAPAPPAQSVSFLKGPSADINDGLDNDHDGTVDETDEQCLFNSFIYFKPSDFSYQNPNSAPLNAGECISYMHSLWKDGTHLMYGDAGYIDTTVTMVETNYSFPGSSDPTGVGQNGQIMPEWTEILVSNLPGDRMGLGTCGPFTFEAGEIISTGIMFNFAQAETENPWLSVEELFLNIPIIQNWYENNTFPSSEILSAPTLQNVIAGIFPNPSSGISSLQMNDDQPYSLEIYDMSGKQLVSLQYLRGNTEINLSNFENGFYLCMIRTEDGNKFIKSIILQK